MARPALIGKVTGKDSSGKTQMIFVRAKGPRSDLYVSFDIARDGERFSLHGMSQQQAALLYAGTQGLTDTSYI